MAKKKEWLVGIRVRVVSTGLIGVIVQIQPVREPTPYRIRLINHPNPEWISGGDLEKVDDDAVDQPVEPVEQVDEIDEADELVVGALVAIDDGNTGVIVALSTGGKPMKYSVKRDSDENVDWYLAKNLVVKPSPDE